MRGLVSVVIPTYERQAKFLASAMESAFCTYMLGDRNLPFFLFYARRNAIGRGN
jgi:hypothetical protein